MGGEGEVVEGEGVAVGLGVGGVEVRGVGVEDFLEGGV